MNAFRTRLAAGVAAAVLVLATGAPFAAAAPHAGKWVGKVTKGEVGPGAKGKPRFKVTSNGKELKSFVIPEVAGFCFTGAQAITVAVPKAKIHAGRVDVNYVIRNNPPDAKPTVHLTGKFTSKTTFKGEVTGKHYCDYDVQFTSHPG